MASRRERFARWLIGYDQLAVTAVVDDSDGWAGVNGRQSHDVTNAESEQGYLDALTAWRKNPIARRIVTITTDYLIGTGITISSSDKNMQKFITAFWQHPKNLIDGRLESMSDELSRSGDLFPLLFRNKQDGMSYLRFLTKDQVGEIETLKSDWETETAVIQKPEGMEPEPTRWYTPAHGRSRRSKAVALHYHISRPLGAQFGEGDLAVAIPWLLRYSRMLEDRVRLHWAARAFLWFVKVPTNKVKQTAAKYPSPPEPGAVIVHDNGEEWEMKTPNVRGADASHDMQAVRNMIDAASGQPPTWRGEDSNVNLSTGDAMAAPTEKHLERRQKHFVFILSDILFIAYQRAREAQPTMWPELETAVYSQLFTASSPEISKSDNTALSEAAKQLTDAFTAIQPIYGDSPTFKDKMLALIFKFAGEPLNETDKNAILTESGEATAGDDE